MLTGKIVAFYTSFYAGLLTLFLVCLAFFSLALDEITPTMTSMSSPLQELPGNCISPAINSNGNKY